MNRQVGGRRSAYQLKQQKIGTKVMEKVDARTMPPEGRLIVGEGTLKASEDLGGRLSAALTERRAVVRSGRRW